MENLIIKTERAELEIEPFDMDKEIRISVTQDECFGIYVSANQANEIISYLAEQLKSINEPIGILTP